MKFLLEQSYDILIYKYNKKPLVKTKSGIILMGVDTKSASMRLQGLRGKKYFVGKNQIAEFGNYIYFPADQVKGIEDEYLDYPKPEKQQYMPKSRWLDIKTEHPYIEGV